MKKKNQAIPAFAGGGATRLRSLLKCYSHFTGKYRLEKNKPLNVNLPFLNYSPIHQIIYPPKKTAFTLAEVLITLGIIGIVAALTMPSFIQKQQDKEAVTALKKSYSTLSQAYLMAVQDYGTPDTWGLQGNGNSFCFEDDSSQCGVGADNALNILTRYLKTVEVCHAKSEGCLLNLPYGTLDNPKPGSIGDVNNPTNPHAAAILQDGTIITIFTYSADCTQNHGSTKQLANGCAGIYIDINGFKGPNTFGYDKFLVYLTKYGILPIGTEQDMQNKFERRCKDGKILRDGFGCAAWVIYNENRDYLRCDNLNWKTKTSCKK